MRFKTAGRRRLPWVASLLPWLIMTTALWLSSEVLQVATNKGAYRRHDGSLQALREHPTDPYTQLARLQRLYKHSRLGQPHRHDEDLTMLNTQVASLAPSDPYIQYTLGSLVLSQPTSKIESLSLFRQTMRLDATYAEKILNAYTRHFTAAEALERFILTIPDTPDGHLKAAQVLENTSWQHAWQQYRTAYALANSDLTIMRAYGRALQHHHVFDAARDIWQRFVVLEPNEATGYLGLADAYQQLGDNTALVSTLQQLVARYPQRPAYRGRLAEAYLQIGKPDAAEAEWRTLTTSLPQSAEGYLGLVRLYESRQNYTDAIAMQRRVIEMAPGTIPYHHQLARLYEKNGERGKALREYQRLAALRPDNARVFYLFGEFFRQAGQNRRAITYYRKALQLAPQQLLALRQMGLTFAAMQDYRRAIGLYRQALTYQPDDSHTYYYLGISYEATGENDLARKAYGKAVTLDPTHPGMRRALENITRRFEDS